jgi:hypothetical protein
MAGHPWRLVHRPIMPRGPETDRKASNASMTSMGKTERHIPIPTRSPHAPGLSGDYSADTRHVPITGRGLHNAGYRDATRPRSYHKRLLLRSSDLLRIVERAFTIPANVFVKKDIGHRPGLPPLPAKGFCPVSVPIAWILCCDPRTGGSVGCSYNAGACWLVETGLVRRPGFEKMRALAISPMTPQAVHNSRWLNENKSMPRLGPKTKAKAQTMP